MKAIPLFALESLQKIAQADGASSPVSTRFLPVYAEEIALSSGFFDFSPVFHRHTGRPSALSEIKHQLSTCFLFSQQILSAYPPKLLA
jgi:hypothetical protein